MGEATEATPSRPARSAGDLELSGLPDDVFEKIVTVNAFPRTRSDNIWQQLQGAALIDRTRAVLTEILERHIAAVRRRESEWADRKATAYLPDYKVELAAYQAQHKRDAWFTSMIHQAISQANVAVKRRNVQASQDDSNAYRLVIRELARAIQRHRELCIDSDEPADEELWAVLDTVSAPNGGALVPVREFAGMSLSDERIQDG